MVLGVLCHKQRLYRSSPSSLVFKPIKVSDESEYFALHVYPLRLGSSLYRYITKELSNLFVSPKYCVLKVLKEQGYSSHAV